MKDRGEVLVWLDSVSKGADHPAELVARGPTFRSLGDEWLDGPRNWQRWIDELARKGLARSSIAQLVSLASGIDAWASAPSRRFVERNPLRLVELPPSGHIWRQVATGGRPPRLGARGLSCGASGQAVTSRRAIRRAPIRSGRTIQMTSEVPRCAHWVGLMTYSVTWPRARA